MTTPPRTDSSEIPPGTVVVGVDGSPHADLALQWAAHQAALEHLPLTVVHGAMVDGGIDARLGGPPGPDVARVLDHLRAGRRELLDDATQRVAELEPEVVVDTVLSAQDPRAALLEQARHAGMVVVGSRGRGPLRSLLLGSVSATVSKYATCPVVVVRHPPSAEPGAGVLVGVDGSEATAPAVELAYRVASARSLPLTALHVFWDARHLGEQERDVADDEPGLEDLRAMLADSVASMREKYPDVDDALVLARGFRDRELVAATHGMDLVVVGSRHPGFLDGFAHGSVAPTVVEHAACDVAVVPAAP